MAVFEVFLPANGPDGFNITTNIEADTWIHALRNGLAKLGDSADIKNIMVDVTQTGMEVTEPISGRVFRIRELQKPDAQSGNTQAPGLPTPPKTINAPPPAAVTAPQITTNSPQIAPIPPPAVIATPQVTPIPKPAAITPAPRRPITVRPTLIPTAGNRFVTNTGQDITAHRTAPNACDPTIGRGRIEPTRSIEDIMADLFESTQQMYEFPNLGGAAGMILDLAMKTVHCDSGAVFISDINENILRFAAARGPKAEEVMAFTVPVGMGIVGFCAQEGVALAVSDVHKDPYFFAAISAKLGYETQSILCSPAQHEGRVFGALELINKEGGSSFTSDEINVLNFLAHEFAEYLINTGQTGS